MYFLWPTFVQDLEMRRTESHGFVEKDKLLSLMRAAEGCGVPTRFPHPSNLYRLFASKDWVCHMCLTFVFSISRRMPTANAEDSCRPKGT